MTDTEQKALALVNAVMVESGWGCVSLAMAQARYGHGYGFEALCRAIDAHEADKKAFSDAITAFWPTKPAPEHFQRFILPDPEPDPLVEIWKRLWPKSAAPESSIVALRNALADRGWKMNLERIEQ